MEGAGLGFWEPRLSGVHRWAPGSPSPMELRPDLGVPMCAFPGGHVAFLIFPKCL